jgi:hypothetical protein
MYLRLYMGKKLFAPNREKFVVVRCDVAMERCCQCLQLFGTKGVGCVVFYFGGNKRIENFNEATWYFVV